MRSVSFRQLSLQQAVHGRVPADQIVQRPPAEQGDGCAALKIAVDDGNALFQQAADALRDRQRDRCLAGAPLEVDRCHDPFRQIKLGHRAIPVVCALARHRAEARSLRRVFPQRDAHAMDREGNGKQPRGPQPRPRFGRHGPAADSGGSARFLSAPFADRRTGESCGSLYLPFPIRPHSGPPPKSAAAYRDNRIKAMNTGCRL